MNINSQSGADHHAPAGGSFAEAALELFASVKFAVVVMVLIAAACVIGTVLPQGPQAVAFVEKHPAAAERFEMFRSLGLTHVFSARWFIALLCVLAATVMVCSTRRLAVVRRAGGFAQRRALGSLLTHISILLILAGGVARGMFGERGWLELREGQTFSQFQTEDGPRPLPFSVQLRKFEIATDGSLAIENFRSTVALSEAGAPVDERTIAVNSPLKFKGYKLYQTGYRPNDWTWTSLEVVRDPGVPLVYTGFLFLTGGLFVVFYLNPWLSRKANA